LESGGLFHYVFGGGGGGRHDYLGLRA